ncbi:MAG: phosphoserine phosphatase SerB [Succinivibrionaceae bacterium]
MINISELSDAVTQWSLSGYWTSASADHFNEEQAPCGNAAVSLLMGNNLVKKHVQDFLALAQKYHLGTSLVDVFAESGVKCALFLHDHFDAEFSGAVKFYDWDIDGLHVGSLPDPRTSGLILLDMDATCVQCECIDEMAKLAGIGDQVSAVTAMAMKGHMDFQESFRKRIALFAGKPESVMDTVEANLPVMPGFSEMVRKAKSCGWHIAIASGGFTRFVTKLKREYDLDYVTANDIEAVDGVFTGKVLGRIVDSSVKAQTLLMLKEQFHLDTRNTMAVGDGANDLPMISLAGTGVAIHAKPVVREKAPVAISNLNLQAIAVILEAGLRLQSRLKA